MPGDERDLLLEHAPSSRSGSSSPALTDRKSRPHPGNEPFPATVTVRLRRRPSILGHGGGPRQTFHVREQVTRGFPTIARGALIEPIHAVARQGDRSFTFKVNQTSPFTGLFMGHAIADVIDALKGGMIFSSW